MEAWANLRFVGALLGIALLEAAAAADDDADDDAARVCAEAEATDADATGLLPCAETVAGEVGAAVAATADDAEAEAEREFASAEHVLRLASAVSASAWMASARVGRTCMMC